MIVRNMTTADLEEVVRIEELSFSQPWSRQSFEDGLRRTENLFLVVEEDGAVRGYVDMYCCMGEGEITNVAVSPESRGRGLSSALMEACLEKAKALAIERIVLEVRVSNEAAIHLYEKYGFEKLGIRKGFYDFPKEDAYIMSLENILV